MPDIFIITSVIHTGTTPWSYTHKRSLFGPKERYEQTLGSIASVRKHCPSAQVILVEGSRLSTEERAGFLAVCDELVDVSTDPLTEIYCIKSDKKGLGDAWLYMQGLKWIGVRDGVIFKLSGRYRLNEEFQRSNISADVPTFCRFAPDGYTTFCFGVPGHMLDMAIAVAEETVRMYNTGENPSLEYYLPPKFGQLHCVERMGAEGKVAVDNSFQMYKV